MQINNNEVNISDLITEDLHRNLHKLYGNDIYLSDNDILVLNRYEFNVNNYSNIKSLILWLISL